MPRRTRPSPLRARRARRGAALLAAALAAGGLGAPGPAAAAGGAPAPTAACPVHQPAGTPYAVGVNCRLVEVDGHPRQFIVYVPRRPRPSAPAPLVFMFHGGSGNGEQFLRISGWREQADATGLIAVFPTALRSRTLDNGRTETHWNTFELATEIDLDVRPPGYPAGAPWPADDVGFADAMVADVAAGLPIDRDRVYASGFSNGGSFTGRLAVERSQVLAAAAFSGGRPERAQAPQRPIPMYLAVGTLDDRVLAQTGPPPLTELPLGPVDLLGVPVVARDARRAPRHARPRRERLRRGRRSPQLTSLRWPAIGTGPGGALLRFAAIGGLRPPLSAGRRQPGGVRSGARVLGVLRGSPAALNARITPPGEGYRTWKPSPVRRPMSLLSPTMNSAITSAKPMKPARSMTLKGIARPRTFSATAQKMWPPSSGRKGKRLITPSDSEITASRKSACSVLKLNAWRVVS